MEPITAVVSEVTMSNDTVFDLSTQRELRLRTKSKAIMGSKESDTNELNLTVLFGPFSGIYVLKNTKEVTRNQHRGIGNCRQIFIETRLGFFYTSRPNAVN